MKDRLKFKCWNCKRRFSLFLEFEGAPRLSKTCYFCSATCIIDFAPYRKETTVVLKDPHAQPGQAADLELPEVIPTSQPDAG